MRPSEEGAIALHRKHGSREVVIAHCKTVASVSKVLGEAFQAGGAELDLQAAVLGALLHDIGRSQTQTVRHGVQGAEILRKEGIDEVVAQIVQRHVGAGISPEEAKGLGFPTGDYIPRTLEQRVVCFSDKMVDSDRVRPFEKEVVRFRVKGHDVGRLLALKERLKDELGEDPEMLVLGKTKEAQ